MCRMLAYSGSGALLRELYDALVKVASADPLEGYKAHGDGWVEPFFVLIEIFLY